MKSLSQSEYAELRSLYESMYGTEEVITEELIDEVVDELVEELVEEGYEEEEAYSLVEEATDTYIDEAKVTFGHDTAARKADGSPVGSRRRYGMRKAGELVKKAKGAVDTVKKKAAGAAAGAAIAGSIAKDEVRRAGRSAAHSASKAADAVKSAPGKAKQKAKSGIKGFIKRQAQKVVKRMSEGYGAPGHNPGSGEKSVARAKALMDKKGKKGAPGLDAMADAKREHEARRGVKKEEVEQSETNIRESLESIGLFSEKEIESILKLGGY